MSIITNSGVATQFNNAKATFLSRVDHITGKTIWAKSYEVNSDNLFVIYSMVIKNQNIWYYFQQVIIVIYLIYIHRVIIFSVVYFLLCRYLYIMGAFTTNNWYYFWLKINIDSQFLRELIFKRTRTNFQHNFSCFLNHFRINLRQNLFQKIFIHRVIIFSVVYFLLCRYLYIMGAFTTNNWYYFWLKISIHNFYEN